MARRKLVGHVGVDSGQVIVIDPCYLQEWKPGDYMGSGPEEDPKNSYDEACKVTTRGVRAGEMKTLSAVVSSTGYGDGNYPVYANLLPNGRVASLTIKFV